RNAGRIRRRKIAGGLLTMAINHPFKSPNRQSIDVSSRPRRTLLGRVWVVTAILSIVLNLMTPVVSLGVADAASIAPSPATVASAATSDSAAASSATPAATSPSGPTVRLLVKFKAGVATADAS